MNVRMNEVSERAGDEMPDVRFGERVIHNRRPRVSLKCVWDEQAESGVCALLDACFECAWVPVPRRFWFVCVCLYRCLLLFAGSSQDFSELPLKMEWGGGLLARVYVSENCFNISRTGIPTRHGVLVCLAGGVQSLGFEKYSALASSIMEQICDSLTIRYKFALFVNINSCSCWSWPTCVSDFWVLFR